VEDELLARLVSHQGTRDWDLIACQISGRNARQCRDRWLSYLAPDVINGPWTAEEEQLLVRKYKQFGASWKRIATYFKGRTDINVKNRWLLMQRRTYRESTSTTRPGSTPILPIPRPPATDNKSPPETLENPWDPFFVIDDQRIPDDDWLYDF
jgi:hypothetical protein